LDILIVTGRARESCADFTADKTAHSAMWQSKRKFYAALPGDEWSSKVTTKTKAPGTTPGPQTKPLIQHIPP